MEPSAMCPRSAPLISADGRYALELLCSNDAISIVRVELATGARATVVAPAPAAPPSEIAPMALLSSNAGRFIYRVGSTIHVSDWTLANDVPYEHARFVDVIDHDRVIVFTKPSDNWLTDDWSVQVAPIGAPLGPATHLSNWMPRSVAELLVFEDDRAGVKPGNRLGGVRLVRLADRDAYVLRSSTVSPVGGELITRLDLAGDTVKESTVVPYGRMPQDAALVGAEGDDVYLQDADGNIARFHGPDRTDFGRGCFDHSARDHVVFFVNEATDPAPMRFTRYAGRYRTPLYDVPGASLLDGVTPDGRFLLVRTSHPWTTQALPAWPPGDPILLLEDSEEPTIFTGGDVVLTRRNERYLIDVATGTKILSLPELPEPMSWRYAQPIQTSTGRFLVTAQTTPAGENLLELGSDGKYRLLAAEQGRFGQVFTAGNRVYELLSTPWLAPDHNTRPPELVAR